MVAVGMVDGSWSKRNTFCVENGNFVLLRVATTTLAVNRLAFKSCINIGSTLGYHKKQHVKEKF